jgi:hypothetical protein
MKRILEKNQFITVKENTQENLQILQEMSTLRKSRSGLPANLYLDDTSSWMNSKHWKRINNPAAEQRGIKPSPRIKFQPNRQEKANPKVMIPMSIEDNPKILIEDVKIDLSQKEIDLIKKFVAVNKDLIIQLGEQKIDIGEFIEKMVRVN